MGMLRRLIFGGQLKCKNCSQLSDPRTGRGEWEIAGKLRGYSVMVCKRCGHGLAMGLASEKHLLPEVVNKLLAMQESETVREGREDRTTPGQSDSALAEYQELAQRWAELDLEKKRLLLDATVFLRHVDGFASKSTPELMAKVSSLTQVGAKTCQGYIGAMMIEGYFLGRVHLGNINKGKLLESILPETRSVAFDAFQKTFSAMNPMDALGRTSPAFQTLVQNVLAAWLAERGLDEIPDSRALRTYLFATMLNGLCWAVAEQEVMLRE